jgi:mono/diheme cytochrome c family protein
MIKTIRLAGTLTILVSLSAAITSAQTSGQDIYKAKCQGCHGATGMAETTVGKTLKVKPVTDPDVKKFTKAQMINATHNGMGKMQAFKDKLTDDQINESVAYFRTFIK